MYVHVCRCAKAWSPVALLDARVYLYLPPSVVQNEKIPRAQTLKLLTASPLPPKPQVEALGTGVWAAPRGGTNTPGAGGATADHQPSPNPNTAAQSPTHPRGGGTVPLVTVETICVVDLRENKPPSGGGIGTAALAVAMEDPAAPLPAGAAGAGGGGGGSSRAPVFATSVLPGELSASVVSTAGGRGVGGMARGKSDRVAEKVKREAAARRRAEKRARDREERR